MSVDAGPDGSWPEVERRLEAARREFAAQAQRFEEARSRLAETSDISRRRRTEPDVLYHSAFARLQARLDTMPVIEQAKGILMAHHQCGPEEAFELLRRASQRGNIKVNVLAEQIVARFVAPGTENGGKPRPLTDSVSR